MFARVVTIMGKPGDLDAGIRYFRDEVTPQIRKMSGFKGANCMVDRKSGKLMVVALWNSEKDVQASDAATAKFRARAAQVVNAANPPVMEILEVAVQA